VKYVEVAKKLRKLGCFEDSRKGTGSHRKWLNPANNKGAPVPDWGSKDLKTGTIRSIVKQLELDWEDFKNT
jgi:predicted RNA binding protein YcfA (HicA-like mRNA interferase family)